ncbi:MAG TPA: peptidylprolyl isomerase [Bacteroidota bacterium]|nr:peptidylprolyl isomerase [Bacteroidota bacterium]
MSILRLVRGGVLPGTHVSPRCAEFRGAGRRSAGDGWGGPGYTLRSEFSTVRYGRGTVGMASAGKDTEGSQFFITHSPQPHLDGRYTVVGRVLRGMDVVDALRVGDRIVDARTLP